MRALITRVSSAGLLAAALLGSAGIAAQPRGYSAALQTPLATPRQEIVGGVLWKCTGERCAAPADGSRAVLVCERVAKAFGPVAGFAGPAGVLSAGELSRCNGTN